ncbi:MarR family transcriptional regulator [Curtobacterium flaccumfaciens pv. beticola]|uniref:MarR family winged helix-turn-helix transcriptional regulator n=1 Tax=Curtobacterium flaccumfaciens TaxID=2035 RepID=UPI00349F8846|nr:MarR family transcriptional regulator [Curtobacterium flaccumfaciens pv. basellae]
MKPTVPRMNEAQSRAWVALISATELLPHALDVQLTRDAGLINFEYGILSILNLAKDQTMRMKELASALDSPAPRLSKAITRLEKRGFVERVAGVGDGRAISVHLTREGRKAWLHVTPLHVALARDTLFADYDEAELHQLASLLEPLLRRLDPDGALGRVETPPA